MAVPTHFFKVVLGEFSGGQRAAVGAFVMPNAAIHPQVPLASFTVPISALEEVAGGFGWMAWWLRGVYRSGERHRGLGGALLGVCRIPAGAWEIAAKRGLQAALC
jgi:hypothetical protein